jgi:hypothetical protein
VKTICAVVWIVGVSRAKTDQPVSDSLVECKFNDVTSSKQSCSLSLSSEKAHYKITINVTKRETFFFFSKLHAFDIKPFTSELTRREALKSQFNCSLSQDLTSRDCVQSGVFPNNFELFNNELDNLRKLNFRAFPELLLSSITLRALLHFATSSYTTGSTTFSLLLTLNNFL